MHFSMLIPLVDLPIFIFINFKTLNMLTYPDDVIEA